MNYTTLGSTRIEVSGLALGMMSFGDGSRRAWHLGEEEGEAIVRRAVEAGITFFDTADMYSGGRSEEITGRLLGRLFSNREDFVLATKVFYPVTDDEQGGLSRTRISSAIDASLRRLGVDHVDLYQIHRWDPDTPIEETMGALHELVVDGKVRALGASAMFAWQFAKAQGVARVAGQTPFATMQDHYNLLYREEEREMIPMCVDQGVAVLPYSPLARGRLTGGRTRRTTRAGSDPLAEQHSGGADLEVIDAVGKVASARGIPRAQVALSWVLGNPAVTAPIVGATKIGQVDDAVAALDIVLTDAEREILETPYRARPVLGHE